MAVTDTPRSVSQRLLGHAYAGLCEWYATPMDERTAAGLQRFAEQHVQQQRRGGNSAFQSQLLVLICRWWLQQEVRALFGELQQSARDSHRQALLHLVYGQLLASCKLRPAREQLGNGFRLAVPLLSNQDYFRLLRRHEVLGRLCFGTTPAPPLDLPALLAEGAVIERLQQGERTARGNAHLDTLG